MPNFLQKTKNFLNPRGQGFLGGALNPATDEQQARRERTGIIPDTTFGQPTQGVLGVQPAQAQATPNVGLPPTPPAVTVDPSQTAVQAPQTSVGGGTGIDALIQQLPALQEALGVGVETESQKGFREQQQATLERLISLQEGLVQQQAPTSTITDLDKVIQQQSNTLRDLTPEGLLETNPLLQQEGITQGALEQEVASKREPIARALSDLLTSRSILGQQQDTQRQQQQQQVQGVQSILQTQQAIGALQPQQGLLPGVQQSILSGVIGQAFEQQAGGGGGEIFSLGNQGIPFQARPDLTATEQQKITQLDSGLRLVDQIERLYNEAVGQEFGGVGSGLVSRAKGISRSILGGLGVQQNFKNYVDFLDSNRAPIAKGIKGEVGNLTAEEQKNALKSFPGRFSSPTEARVKFAEIRQTMTDNLDTLGNFAEQQGQTPQTNLSGINFKL